jgi:hypothetical protein
MKTLTKLLIALAAMVLLGTALLMASISLMHRRSRNEISDLVAEIRPQMPFTAVTNRLGAPFCVFTNAQHILAWGTTTDPRILTNSVLYMFMHRAIPFRWVCVYTDTQESEVVYASWKDM